MTRGPTGRPWRRLRLAVLTTSTTCILCGHHGAGDVHHLTPRSRGGDLLDPANVAPAHGARSPCPVCGRRCNQEQYNHLDPPARRTSRAW